MQLPTRRSRSLRACSVCEPSAPCPGRDPMRIAATAASRIVTATAGRQPQPTATHAPTASGARSPNSEPTPFASTTAAALASRWWTESAGCAAEITRVPPMAVTAAPSKVKAREKAMAAGRAEQGDGQGAAHDERPDAGHEDRYRDEQRAAATEPVDEARAEQRRQQRADRHRGPVQARLRLGDALLGREQGDAGGEAVEQPAPRDEVRVQRDRDAVPTKADRRDR